MWLNTITKQRWYWMILHNLGLRSITSFSFRTSNFFFNPHFLHYPCITTTICLLFRERSWLRLTKMQILFAGLWRDTSTTLLLQSLSGSVTWQDVEPSVGLQHLKTLMTCPHTSALLPVFSKSNGVMSYVWGHQA